VRAILRALLLVREERERQSDVESEEEEVKRERERERLTCLMPDCASALISSSQVLTLPLVALPIPLDPLTLLRLQVREAERRRNESARKR
jgi:hypothetical protein